MSSFSKCWRRRAFSSVDIQEVDIGFEILMTK